MKIELERFRRAFSALPQGVTEAEVCADFREELSISVTDGVQSAGESFSRTALYLRASGDKTGAVLSENPEDDPYALMEKAMANAAFSQAAAPEPLNSGEPVHIVTGCDGPGAGDLLAAARRLEEAARSLPGVAALGGCTLRKAISARRVVNSKGLDRYLEHTYYTATLAVATGRPGIHGKAELSADSLDALDLPALAALALENADRLDMAGALSPTALPSGRYKAVLSSTVVRNIMITAWQAFTGERMAGSSSVFGPETGGVIGSQALSIVDDPAPAGWAVNLALDSEGTLCNPKDILRRGRLVTPLHTLQSARDLGHQPTGNAGRVAGLTGTTPVGLVTIPSCIYVEPGQSTPQALLEAMGDGIHLTYSLDVFHSINIASGEFSIPCGGILYWDGKPVGTVDQLTVAGNLKELLGGIEAVGNDLTFEEFIFYRNYCFGGPSLLADGLAFTGRQ